MDAALAYRSFFFAVFGFLVTEGVIDIIYQIRSKKKSSITENIRTWARSLFMIVAGLVIMLLVINTPTTVSRGPPMQMPM